ncbi:MAG: hypothetical protein ACRCW2_10565 [Cellulosilyticaceae bacterium]
MKALIKHELRNIWMILLYFVGAFTIGVFNFADSLARDYNSYLWNGYSYDMAPNLLHRITRLGEVYMMAMALGLLVLLYVQFKENKSVSVSCFIKSLPYTNQQIYGVKLGCGVLSFTVPFVIAYGSIIAVGQSYKGWLGLIEQVSPVGERLAQLNNIDQILLYGLVIYSITLMVYLFGFWMQYIVNPNVASLVISSCTLAALPYLAYAVAEYIRALVGYQNIDHKVEGLTAMIQRIGSLLMLPNYFVNYAPGVELIWDGNKDRSGYIHTLVHFENLGMTLVLMLLISLIFVLAIYSCNRTYRAENQEQFIGYKWAEIALKVGVALSTASFGIIFTNIVEPNARIEKIALHAFMLIFGAIGYAIINKICKIGQK